MGIPATAGQRGGRVSQGSPGSAGMRIRKKAVAGIPSRPVVTAGSATVRGGRAGRDYFF
ncbi:hypothetical protein GCM10009414_29200 [Tatumella terrea]